MHVEGFVAQDGSLIDSETVLTRPSLFGQLQQLLVARLAIGPEDALDGYDVATAHNATCQVVGREVQVVLLQGSRDALVAVVLVFCLQHAEEYGHRPCDAHQRGITKHTVLVGMCQRVFDALHSLGDHLFGIELVAQTEQSVGVVGGLLITPPVVAVGLIGT